MTAKRRIGVLVHADDPVVYSGVLTLLRPRPELSLQTEDESSAASVLVLCVDSVDASALALLRTYWRTRTLQTVLLVGQILEAELFEALECGVRTIVRRQEASPERLVHAIAMADRGAGDLPPDMLGNLLGQIGRALRTGSDSRSAARAAAPLPGLSQREIDVVRLVAEGFDTREIAAKLSYSERTIKNVIQGIMVRLNLRNRAHVVAHAAREGYLR
ncbi:MAG TPA: response regulator transcription factor [Trebonia sp.]|jgi:DNA-binding NarL/FixJ family response regulator